MNRATAGVAILIGAQALAAGCSSYETGRAPPATIFPSQEAVFSFSGEEIFRGYFFGEGRAATMFPEVWSESRERSAARRYAQTPSSVAALELALERSNPRGVDGAAEMRKLAEAELARIASGEVPLPDAKARARAANAVVKSMDRRHPAFFPRFAGNMRSGNPQLVSAAVAAARSDLLSAFEETELYAREAALGDVTRLPDAHRGDARGPSDVAAVVSVVIAAEIAWQTLGREHEASYARDVFLLDVAQRFARTPKAK
jgi:hypothetical protein